MDNDQNIPTVGELVNHKRGKQPRKDSKVTVPLEVFGMDIGYSDGASYGGSKYVLVLVDQCTSDSFTYSMQVLPVLMFVEQYGNSLLML